MHVEQELEEWLTSNIRDNRENKSRNIKAVLNYYGFGELASPTLEQIGIRLSIGTRERVRQVINANFKEPVELRQLHVATRIFEIIQSHQCVPIPEIRTQLVREGLASQNTTLRGLLNLARDLKTCEGYDLYDSSLKKLSRSEAEFDSKTFLVHKDTLVKLQKSLKRARTLVGLLGLAKFDYLRSELGDGVETETDRLIQFIRGAPDACIILDEGEEWYIFEDRDNTLINSCEKIYKLTDQWCRLPILAATLQNSLRRRSHKYDYPQANLISAWIEQSKWFLVENQAAKFLGGKREFTEIEAAAVAYLRGREFSNYPEFLDHLRRLGYGKPAADKVITTSPLVTVDKTGQRGTYTYQLIEKGAKVADDAEAPSSRYQLFKNRLKEVLTAGTDSMSESIVRREQSILRGWLFSDLHESKCAICGEIFSITALVAAHKKKRTSCNDSERVDPNIVFPLCKFGCDYLYEVGMILIVGGVVQASEIPVSSTIDSKRARALAGTEIDKKWLCGNKSYFSRNLT